MEKERTKAVLKIRQMGLSQLTFFAPKIETDVILLSLFLDTTYVRKFILCQSLRLHYYKQIKKLFSFVYIKSRSMMN